MRARSAASAGFTYVWLLLAVAFMAAGLAAVAEVATTAMRRDKEADLLFVGDQFARAIALYRASSPGAQQYPPAQNSLTVSDTTPTPGQTIDITAQTFVSGSTVTLTLNSEPVSPSVSTVNRTSNPACAVVSSKVARSHGAGLPG